MKTLQHRNNILYCPMTHDNDPPNPHQSPLTLPDDLTAEALTKLTSATLSPNHPATDLKRMNDKLLVLLHEEGDQTRLLLRQSAVLNSLFHFLLNQSTTDLDNDGTGKPALDLNQIALALKTQNQCAQTVRDVQSIQYMQTIATQIQEKPLPPHLNHYHQYQQPQQPQASSYPQPHPKPSPHSQSTTSPNHSSSSPSSSSSSAPAPAPLDAHYVNNINPTSPSQIPDEQTEGHD